MSIVNSVPDDVDPSMFQSSTLTSSIRLSYLLKTLNFSGTVFSPFGQLSAEPLMHTTLLCKTIKSPDTQSAVAQAELMSVQPSIANYITGCIWLSTQTVLQYLVTPLRTMSGDHDASAAGPRTDETTGASATRPAHEPTIADVLVIKTMLNRSLRLPPEIIDTVVDLAEYWPHSSTEVPFNDGSVVARGNNIHTQGTGQENSFIVSGASFISSPWFIFTEDANMTGYPPCHRFAPPRLVCAHGGAPSASLTSPSTPRRRSHNPLRKSFQSTTSKISPQRRHPCSPTRVAVSSLPSKAMTRAGAETFPTRAHITARGHGLKLE